MPSCRASRPGRRDEAADPEYRGRRHIRPAARDGVVIRRRVLLRLVERRPADGRTWRGRVDVVVVTVNQRLNVFGHLHLGDLGRAAIRIVGQCRHASTWSRRSNVCATTSRASAAIPATSRSSASRARRQGQQPCSRCGGARPVPQAIVMTRLGDSGGRARARTTAGRGGAARVGIARGGARPAVRPCLLAQCAPRSKPAENRSAVDLAAVRPLPAFGPMSTARWCRASRSIRRRRRCPRSAGAGRRRQGRDGDLMAPERHGGNRSLSEAGARERVRKSRGDSTERVLATYRRLTPT